ncbi:MAG TPA: hypothetical protein VFU62_13070, partial [Hanamia sp.]|nr:hypothetical protein [Hanamia sp.]
SLWSLCALAISINQFLLLFFSIGAVIPIRYIAGTFMCLQMLLGPTFAYNGLDQYQFIDYKMRIPEAEYFAYAIPAVLMFILGLHVTAGKLKGEIINEPEIRKFIDNSGQLPYIFIGIGFLAGFVAGSFGSELAFVFVLLSGFKYIGLFMLLLGSKQLKLWAMILVFGSIIASSLSGAMFHDLLTWLIMLGAVLAIKFKPNVTLKAVATTGFILVAVVIQQLKGEYRQTLKSESGNFNTFENVYQENNNSVFDFKSLASNNTRINQGFIITNIMNTVPEKVPFENGKELMRILEAAFLPRIIAPNKLNAGDRAIFAKYSRIPLAPGTSMALGAMGDGYINFGIMGGCIFMFFLGLAFSEVLNGFYKFSKFYPFLLLFTPLVFYYPIRPDCELQTSLGHLVKSCFLIYMMLIFWKKDLSKVQNKKQKSSELKVSAAT